MGFAGGTTTIIEKSISVKDFLSDADNPDETDTDLPDIVVAGLPSDITLTRVVLLVKARAIENTSP